jgi:cobalt-zinc-cadmium efflux system membrane fusion protein
VNSSLSIRAVARQSTLPPTPRKIAIRWILAVTPILGLILLVIGHYTLGTNDDLEPKLPIIDTPHVEGKRIVFSERFAAKIGLKTVEIKDASLVPTVSVIGEVTFNPQYVAQVGTRLRGLVRDVFRFEGTHVKQGELLAQIDSPELGEAQAAVSTLKAQTIAAKQNAKRELDLAEKRLTTQKESEEAIATENAYSAMLAAAQQKVAALAGRYSDSNRQNLGLHQLVSPLEGTIVERNIAKGQLVDGSHTAFLIANLDYLWVELSVFERSLPAIREGDNVELRPLGYTGPPIQGRVAQIGQSLDEHTRSAAVRVQVDNKDRRLRPGQAIDATIHTSGTAIESGIVVAPTAVTFVDGKPTVFVADSPNSVVPTEVTLGVSSGQGQQILKGLKPGQFVVTDGAFELKSELYR